MRVLIVEVRLVLVARVVLTLLVLQPRRVHMNFSPVLPVHFFVLVKNVHLLLVNVFLVLKNLILLVQVHVLGLVVRMTRGRVLVTVLVTAAVTNLLGDGGRHAAAADAVLGGHRFLG